MRLQTLPLIIHTLRILLYKTCYVIKIIRWILKYFQMSVVSSLQGVLSTLSR